MQIPDDLIYTTEHEWICEVGARRFRLGITEFAQDQLGDVVYVGLPTLGARVGKDDLLVEIESTKSVGEVYAPFAGTITTVNEAVSASPDIVNTSPYEAGWLVEIETNDDLVVESFIDSTAYRDLTE